MDDEDDDDDGEDGPEVCVISLCCSFITTTAPNWLQVAELVMKTFVQFESNKFSLFQSNCEPSVLRVGSFQFLVATFKTFNQQRE